jgi:hypothetical protein
LKVVHQSAARAAIEFSPAFQRREHQHALQHVASATIEWRPLDSPVADATKFLNRAIFPGFKKPG